MPINKNAWIRYRTLDRCFSNPGRKYFIEDLIEECNIALYNYAGKDICIQKRQVYKDIKFMESTEGWSIPLVRVTENRRKYFRYNDKNFSINNLHDIFKQEGLKQIEGLISQLNHFSGLPNLEWLKEINIRLENSLNKHDFSPFISFQHNPYISGLKFFTPLYRAIKEQRVVKISYQAFHRESAKEHTIHPYYLKNYDNRWFIFGYNKRFDDLSIFSLDRIKSVQDEKGINYIPNNSIDFKEYFEDCIGVSVNKDQPVENIVLEVAIPQWYYVKSAPLHGSQKVLERKPNSVTLQLQVSINKELEKQILALGEHVKILAPYPFKQHMKQRLEKMLANMSEV